MHRLPGLHAGVSGRGDLSGLGRAVRVATMDRDQCRALGRDYGTRQGADCREKGADGRRRLQEASLIVEASLREAGSTSAASAWAASKASLREAGSTSAASAWAASKASLREA